MASFWRLSVMEKKGLSTPRTMKRRGQRTEERISSLSNKLSINGEGNSFTLPFVDDVEELSKFMPLDHSSKDGIRLVSRKYPLRISRHYLSLIDEGNPLSS